MCTAFFFFFLGGGGGGGGIGEGVVEFICTSKSYVQQLFDSL